KRGCWRIILIRGKAAQGPEPPPQEMSELIELLKARGVTAKIAAELVEVHPAGRIQTKVDVFDWLLKNEDKRVGKNPAGYLVASIRADYEAPGDFRTAAPKAKAPAASRTVATGTTTKPHERRRTP